MIAINDVLGWVTGKLDISRKVTQFSIDTFLRDVDDGVVKICRRYPTLRKVEIFTTGANQGDYSIDVEVRPLRILDIVHPWSKPLQRLQTQQMREYIHLVDNDIVNLPYASYTDQPSYWAFYPSSNSGEMGDLESPGAIVRFYDTAAIASGLTLTIEYSYIPRILKIADLGMTVDMGEEYKLALCSYVAWQQAIRYSDEIGKDKIRDLKELYISEMQDIMIDHRRNLQSNQLEYREILPF